MVSGLALKNSKNTLYSFLQLSISLHFGSIPLRLVLAGATAVLGASARAMRWTLAAEFALFGMHYADFTQPAFVISLATGTFFFCGSVLAIISTYFAELALVSIYTRTLAAILAPISAHFTQLAGVGEVEPHEFGLATFPRLLGLDALLATGLRRLPFLPRSRPRVGGNPPVLAVASAFKRSETLEFSGFLPFSCQELGKGEPQTRRRNRRVEHVYCKLESAFAQVRAGCASSHHVRRQIHSCLLMFRCAQEMSC